MGQDLPPTVNLVRVEVTSRELCELARGLSLSVMRNTRFIADFGALLIVMHVNRHDTGKQLLRFDSTCHVKPSCSW
jgi:hypothetical protein